MHPSAATWPFLPASRTPTGVMSGSFMGLLRLLGEFPGVLCHEDKSKPDFGSPSPLQHFSTGWKRVLKRKIFCCNTSPSSTGPLGHFFRSLAPDCHASTTRSSALYKATLYMRFWLCFRSQWGVGVPCLLFLYPTAYPEVIGADHAIPLIPVPNLTLSGLCGPPVSRYPRWQRRSGVVLDLPFS